MSPFPIPFQSLVRNLNNQIFYICITHYTCEFQVFQVSPLSSHLGSAPGELFQANETSIYLHEWGESNNFAVNRHQDSKTAFIDSPVKFWVC